MESEYPWWRECLTPKTRRALELYIADPPSALKPKSQEATGLPKVTRVKTSLPKDFDWSSLPS